MSIALRVALILFSVITMWYTLRKIRKSKMKIEDSSFWIVLAILILILSVFPAIAEWGANLLGIQEPANFIFLCFLFVILLKLFSLSVKVSQMESKITELTLELAIKDNLRNEHDNNQME